MINMRTEEIIKEALSFSPGEKAKMIEALLSSMDRPDSEIDALWSIEADARLDSYKNGKTVPIPFDKVFPPQ